MRNSNSILNKFFGCQLVFYPCGFYFKRRKDFIFKWVLGLGFVEFRRWEKAFKVIGENIKSRAERRREWRESWKNFK